MNLKNRMYLFLFILTVANISVFQGWRTMFNNFAVEVASINGYQMGIIQSVREVPGFLALLVIFVIRLIPEHRIASLSVILSGLGVLLTGFLPSFYGLIITTLIMSFGFHYYETINQSLTLQYFNKAQAPLVFGRLKGIAAGTSILVGLAVMGLLKVFEYREIFLILGVPIVLIGFGTLFFDPTNKDMPIQHKKMIFRKRYWLFYLLTFLAGARRQIFVAFAVFLMVIKFEFSAFEITALFVLNNAVNYFANPLIGRAINRFGERKVLSVEYFSLIWIFCAYAFTDSKMVVAVMYILDHIFFNFHIAIRTFFHKIGDSRDIAPSMAVGFTINHIAAVVIPVLGGALWMLDYRIPFISAVVLSVASLVFTQFIDREITVNSTDE
ncbi:MFS transporter [Limisalsivibrio acetivorans]|uniref:MFS transporter n=1 Tax=Limisalsivibrio acetivorans TaxID=1304888 RepID=UPI0003B2E4CA|nr:MFS transporter [Limisalsivibrio acetivorans]